MSVFERSAVLLALVAAACLPDDPRLSEARVPEPEPAETDTALYVDGAAPEGGEGTRARPLRSLGAAFARAKSDAELGRVIKLCAGDYAERELRLDFPVSLEGQYDCGTWERRLGVTGFETRLLNAAPELSLATLWLAGEALGPEVVIEGLAILGTTAFRSATAVVVTEGASPTLRGCTLDGGGGSNGEVAPPEPVGAVKGFGSVGLWVIGGHPSFFGSTIEGGHGVAPVGGGAGSIGVFVDGGAVTLRDSRVDGGDGAAEPAAGGAFGSIAVDIAAATPEPATLIERCTLYGGRGVGGASQLSSLGMTVWNGGAVDVSASLIDGGDGTGGTRSQAVRVNSQSRVRLISNRIHGGRGHGTNDGPYGIELLNGAVALLENNLLAASDSTLPERTSYALSWGNTRASIRHNTILGSVVVPGERASVSAQLVAGAVTVENNLIDTGLYIVVYEGQAPFAAFRNNGLIHGVGASGPLASVRNRPCVGEPPCAAWESPGTLKAPADVASLELELGGSAWASGNVVLDATCTNLFGVPLPGCIVVPGCTSRLGCVQTLFADWDTQGPGAFAAASADTPPGWSLSSLAPIAVTQGGLGADELTSLSGVPSDDGRLATDLLGRARPAVKPSIGAQQWEGR